MAIGNPLLATYAEDTLIRTYEYVNGVFVPLGVSIAYPHNPSTIAIAAGNPYPYFSWKQQDQYLFLYNSPNPDANLYRSLDQFGALVNTLDAGSYSNTGGIVGFKIKDTAQDMTKTNSAGSNLSGVTINPVGAIGQTVSGILSGSDIIDLAGTPDGNVLTGTRLNGTPGIVILRTSNPGVVPVSYGAANNIVTDIYPQIIGWMGDNTTAIVVNTTNNKAASYTFNKNTITFSKNQELDMNVGAGYSADKVRVSPDGVRLAIAFKNAGGDYITRVWRRTGAFMIVVDTFAGFGSDLAWSVDGIMLVDSASKKARLRVAEDFTNADAAMVNVAADVVKSVLSAAPIYKSATASIYLRMVENVGEKTLDFANLKFTLLTSAAVFNEANTTINQVTNNGANEVTGGTWPTGGILLENVSSSMVGTEYDFKADDAKWLTFSTPMTWRYAVIYDETSNEPLIWFDYYGERTVAANREVHFEFANGAFAAIRR